MATSGAEDLLHELKQDYTAFLYMGELVEFDETDRIFTTPVKQQTQDYITGRFGSVQA